MFKSKVSRDTGRLRGWWVPVALVALLAFPAAADSVTFQGSGPGVGANALMATATFDITGNNLVITLTNSSPLPTEIPAEVLTGVYFDLAGSPSLTPVSVFLAPGSVVQHGSTGPAVGEVSGEWAFNGNIGSGFNGADYGVSSTGLSVFGPGNRFGTVDLDSPASPGGLNYGLISYIGPNANSPILTEPLIQSGVVISFTFAGSLSVDDISNVGFQYGTSTTEPFIPGPPVTPPFPPTPVPEPASISLLGVGLLGLAMRFRSRHTA